MLSYFTNFDKLIGTKLIVLLYWLGLIGIALGGLGGIFGGLGSMRYGFLSGLGMVIASIVGAALAVLFWRFICEVYLLLFRMADDLRDIKTMKSGAPVSAS
ncbi:MAG: DUF4282 domain-containing protein [Hyphomonas sp.]|uniref:DUF4282 domain-containing protein n=1 Tax=Hyphomonas sp. TaxID=87 RepID=UPI0017B3960D|nr:DUF4282 domain-containing protein [Hyphomonas sp.]MBU3919067.1 DUF4282 domain-containing protein [Alphaproteobacteria bacterium]MBA3068699.1 DUF4282 domain-containing protein [Hyphomonas sp.]MBU4063638.1 DUF4282 domain-containing protein [Alphaproteobacteria bacterium]MBU4165737.1 DUF4282 domain-containing protein [Alphaproteobacteria bacterium]MBU4567743.1 DUF4282 domain-containing protein [Alphaproteobacteria bacterium]